MLARNIWPPVILLTFCFLGSVLLGFLVHGGVIFDAHRTTFQFVASGAVCGIFVVAGNTFGRRGMLAVALIVYVAALVLDGSATGALWLRDGVGILGLLLAVSFGLWNNRFLSQLVFGKFVVWGVAFGLIHLGMFALLSLLTGAPVNSVLAVWTLRTGALIGLGVGFGCELAELVNRRWATGTVSR